MKDKSIRKHMARPQADGRWQDEPSLRAAVYGLLGSGFGRWGVIPVILLLISMAVFHQFGLIVRWQAAAMAGESLKSAILPYSIAGAWFVSLYIAAKPIQVFFADRWNEHSSISRRRRR
jgi:hypothetical protein